MKKLVLTIALLAGITMTAGNAQALQPFRFDLDLINGAGGTQLTSVFDAFNGNISATSTYSTEGYPLPGDTFTDVGSFGILALKNGGDAVFSHGLGSLSGGFPWELRAEWTSLTGTVLTAGAVNTFDYNAGTVNMIAEYAGSGVGPITVATLLLDDGFGSLVGTTGSVNLSLSFDSLLEGFWLNPDGSSATSNLLAEDIVFSASLLASNAALNLGSPGVDTTIVITNESGNGNISSSVVTPEPASMILFGSGMLGFLARRKKKILA